MTPRRRRYDEDDVRVRPGRGSRPRTRQRPEHADASTGFVVTVDRGRYTCMVGDREVTAVRARELSRRAIVVGDRVALVGDVSAEAGTLARIVRVRPRTSALRRTADDTDPVERVVVANADQVAIVCALASPEPRPRLVDRCLVACFDAGIDPLLVLSKADLADPEALIALYAPLGVQTVTTRLDAPLDDLGARLRGRITALVGQSGVGKSTLMNRLVLSADRATGAVNVVTGRGRHISTSSQALPLPAPGGGWLIDTPGVRSLGLAHVDVGQVLGAFPDLAPGTADCPRGCDHTVEAPECALDAWVAQGHADPERLDSLRRLLATRERHEGD